jgi:predicted nucleic acid-binding protein
VRHLFVDTSFHVAVFNDADDLHVRAVHLSDELTLESATRFVTTEAVLVEFLTFVRRAGPQARLGAADYVEALRLKPGVTIVSDTREVFDAGLDLYRQRPDKTYSMTDCMSMVVCRERGITGVLTYDRDFEQEGFVAMLRGA